MKKFFFICLLTVISVFASNAEVLKFRTSYLATKYYNEFTSSWGAWSEWEDCNVLVVIDVDKDRITIYSQKEQVFDIISCDGEKEDSDGLKSKYTCVDENGIRCQMRMIISDDSICLYFDYADMSYVYAIYPQ